MDNHYPMLVETPQGNLSQAMHYLNATYGNWFRHFTAKRIQFRCFNVTQNVRVYPINFANYPIATNIASGTGIVEWRTVGTSPDGVVLMPNSGRIVVCTMDGSVYAESHAYTIDD